MTSYIEAHILLSDLEEFADNNDFPKAEKLIPQARKALEKDFGRTLHPVQKPKEKSSQDYKVQ